MPLKALVIFKNGTQKASDGIEKSLNIAVQRSIKLMERNIKVETPVRDGNLRRSIRSQMTDGLAGEVFTAAVSGGKEINYAAYIEYGTRHIAPRAMFRKGVAASEDGIKKIFSYEAWRVKNGFTL